MAASRTYRPVTLGSLADQGMDVWAWCNGCFKNGAVTTDTLIARLGHAYPVPDVGAWTLLPGRSVPVGQHENVVDGVAGVLERHDVVDHLQLFQIDHRDRAIAQAG